jgi:hypothetical protein
MPKNFSVHGVNWLAAYRCIKTPCIVPSLCCPFSFTLDLLIFCKLLT